MSEGRVKIGTRNAISLSWAQKKGGMDMSKVKTVVVTLVITGFSVLVASTAFARSLNLKDAGISLWIFIIIGGMLILLQLIPAGILFFSFIGSASTLAFKQKKISGKKESEEEKKQVLSGEPLTAQK